MTDKRKYRRVAADIEVHFFGEHTDRQTRKAMIGVAKNFNYGGMFFASDHHLPEGSLAALEFLVPAETGTTEKVKATAVVRWVQRWHKPKGMGLEFIEFEGIGHSSFKLWMDRLFEQVEAE